MDIGQKIEEMRREKGLTLEGLGDLVGVGKSTVRKWETGNIRNMRRNNILKLSEVFDCDPRYLMGWPETDEKPEPKGVKIPVVGRVAAGIPIEATEEIIDWEEIPERMAKGGKYFGLQIKGHSMEPRIVNGDTVIVRKQDDAEDGDIVIAIVNGDDGVCKRLKKYSDSIALVSLNPAYEPMIFTAEEQASKPVRIIGKVVELRGKF